MRPGAKLGVVCKMRRTWAKAASEVSETTETDPYDFFLCAEAERLL